MGYYVDLIEYNAKLMKSDLDEAYRLMCELNNDNSLKTGGRFPRDVNGGPHDGIWFAWMPWNYPDIYENALEILEALGFDYYEEDDSIIICSYSDKTGAEEVFLNSLGPLWAVISDNDHPYFAWRGEDGEMWRVIYVDGKPQYQSAVIGWK